MAMMGEAPKSPPQCTHCPGFFPGTGISRVAVVFWLMTPMAISSAIRALMVSASVSPGMQTISNPTEHTEVMASSFSMERVPSAAALARALSSATGINSAVIITGFKP